MKVEPPIPCLDCVKRIGPRDCNLMIIPIRESLLYVEPIYLQATQSKMPELKRVIVSYEDEVVMAKNLTEAILDLFNVSKEKNTFCL